MFAGCVTQKTFLQMKKNYNTKIEFLYVEIDRIKNEISVIKQTFATHEIESKLKHQQFRKDIDSLMEEFNDLDASLKTMKTEDIEVVKEKIKRLVETTEKIRLEMLKSKQKK
jgi:hypothetical protein